MLTVQYKGKGERTIGTQVVYPGELLHASPSLLAAWQAEHGDVFALVGGNAPPAPPAETEPEATKTDPVPAETEAETEAETKAKRK